VPSREVKFWVLFGGVFRSGFVVRCHQQGKKMGKALSDAQIRRFRDEGFLSPMITV
jgi:hypothetical protein